MGALQSVESNTVENPSDPRDSLIPGQTTNSDNFGDYETDQTSRLGSSGLFVTYSEPETSREPLPTQPPPACTSPSTDFWGVDGLVSLDLC